MLLYFCFYTEAISLLLYLTYLACCFVGVGYYFGQICNVLVAVNSSVNVIIFVVVNRSVRERLRQLCCAESNRHEQIELSEKTRSTLL